MVWAISLLSSWELQHFLSCQVSQIGSIFLEGNLAGASKILYVSNL